MLSIDWRLPQNLPANVKFIISTLPDMYGILDSARFIGLPDSNFVPVDPLDESTAWSIIDYWLNSAQRTVSCLLLIPCTASVLTQCFCCVSDDRESEVRGESSSLPEVSDGSLRETSLRHHHLMEIIYCGDRTARWCHILSGPVVWQDGDWPWCVDMLIKVSWCGRIFISSSVSTGELQVKHCMGYITCCPGGISQVELEDILSLDDDFLIKVYQVPSDVTVHFTCVLIIIVYVWLTCSTTYPQWDGYRQCCGWGWERTSTSIW